MNSIASGIPGVGQSYLMRYIGSMTGYAANYEYRVSIVVGTAHGRGSPRTIGKSTLLASNVTDSGSLHCEGVNDLRTFNNGTGDVENGRQVMSSPC